jgi:C1A family cysteine protease
MKNHKRHPQHTLFLILGIVLVLLLISPTAFAAVDTSNLSVKTKLVQNGGVITDEAAPEIPFSTSEDESLATQGSDASYPAKYDLRNVDGQSYVTPVKFQNPFGNCWAFGALASVESNVLRQGFSSPNFSEKALSWYNTRLQQAPGAAEDLKEGIRITDVSGNALKDYQSYMAGNAFAASNQLVTWNASSNSDAVPYRNDSGETTTMGMYAKGDKGPTVKNATYYTLLGGWALSDSHLYDNAYHLQDTDFILFNKTDVQASENQIKEKLTTTGAVSLFYADEQQDIDGKDESGKPYTTGINYTYCSQYVDTPKAADHSVAIIGWDDDFPKEHFGKTDPNDTSASRPPANGAWLVKNSWSTAWADEGYFWISYYDQSLSIAASNQVNMAKNGLYDYDYNNQYDYAGEKNPVTLTTEIKIAQASENKKIKVANIFTAESPQTLKAVSAQTVLDTANVTTEIYSVTDPENPTAGPLLTSQTDKVATGYHTIDLNTPISLKAGDKYAVVQTIAYTDAAGTAYGVPVEMNTADPYTLQATEPTSTTNPPEKYTYKQRCVATNEPGQSFVWGIGTDEWHDLADKDFVSKYYTVATDITNYDGSVIHSTSTPGNVMIKAFTVNSAGPKSPSASVTPVTITGDAGQPVVPQTVTVKLTNDTFKDVYEGMDVTAFFPNLPAGLKAVVTRLYNSTSAEALSAEAAADSWDTMDITISGTPATSGNAVLTLVIPSEYLNRGTVINSSAAVTADIAAPAAPSAQTTVVQTQTASAATGIAADNTPMYIAIGLIIAAAVAIIIAVPRKRRF